MAHEATHLAPVDVVEDKVELVRRLEGEVEAHQERVVQVLQQHVALGHDVVALVALQDHLLLQHLHATRSRRFLLSRQRLTREGEKMANQAHFLWQCSECTKLVLWLSHFYIIVFLCVKKGQ